MFEKDQQPIHIRELQWLAHYYHMHGKEEKAQEIQDALLRRNTRVHQMQDSEVIELFDHDEQRKA